MAFLDIKTEIKNESGINFENRMCHTCLSVDRKLFPIGNYKELYHRLIRPFRDNYDNVFLLNTKLHGDVLICWECQAVLIKMKLFQQKAIKAQHVLQFMLNQGSPVMMKSFSTLTKINTTALNYENMYSNIKIAMLETETLNKVDREDFENDAWNNTNGIAFVEIETSDNSGGNIKTGNSLKPENKKSSRKKWMEKRAVLNKKPKFKIIPFDNSKSDRSYVKLIMPHEELMNHLEREKNNAVFKSARFKCENCVLLFCNEKSYIRHKNTKHVKRNYECDICHSSFSSKKELIKHCKSHYYKYQCTLCRHLSYKKTEFYNHWYYTHKRKFECIKCKLGFWSRKEFYHHYKEWHQRFECDHCGMSFKMRYCIKSHIRRKHSPFECKMCNKRFSRYNGLWLHNKVKHPTQELEKAYCVECNKHFDNVYCYKWHLNNSVVHKPRKKVRVPCPSCDKVFSKNIYMKDHFDLVHLKNYKYRCEACDKNFSRNADLVKHRRRVHEGVQVPRNKICYVCGRGFSSNKILNNHIRTHTGEKPFACAHCPARFAQSVALSGHQKNVHFKTPKSDAFALAAQQSEKAVEQEITV